MSDAAPAADAAADHDVDLIEWGRRIREWRLARGMTQKVLARRVGLHTSRNIGQDSISEWEQGHRRPNDEIRIAVARVLCVPIGDLFPYPPDVTGSTS